MEQEQILKALSSAASARDREAALRRKHADRVSELARQARAAGIGVTEIAREAALSRQAVYEALRE